MGNECLGVGDLVDLFADDEDGGGSTLDALSGALSGVGLAFAGAHGVRHEALEGFGVSTGSAEGQDKGSESYEFFHEVPPGWRTFVGIIAQQMEQGHGERSVARSRAL